MPKYAIAAALASIVLTAPVLARPMTSEDVARIATVSSMAVSPDGSRIAFGVSQLPDILDGEENGSSETQLFVATGANVARAYLSEEMSVTGISFSPDGRTIGFLWKAEGDDARRGVYGIPVDGGGHRLLFAREDADIAGYRWLPDGRLLVVAGAADDERREAESDAGFNAIVYEEEHRFNRLFVATPGEDGGTNEEIAVDGHVTRVEVAPDGSWTAALIAPTPLIDDSYTSNRVHILDLPSGNVRAVVETPGKIDDFEIAPDGSQIALIAAVDRHDPAATTLHLVDPRTGAYRAINGGAAEAATDTEWLADGRLATIIDVGATTLMRFYRPDGSVESERDAGALAVTGLDAGGGRLAAIADGATHPSELFVAGEGGLSRWTRHNPWLAEIDMGEQRVVTYEARDGLTIEGILIEPAGGVPEGGAPTILHVHGGPESHYSNGWMTSYSMAGQVGAGRGYAVFYPNYRGSTGYGVDFAKLHQNDYAGGEFNDLVDGIEALAARGIVDRDRVGITGGSYGGFASAWGATALSEHFAASVMFVGISNQISKYGTTDIPDEMYLVHAREQPWEDWQFYLERSPIYHAGNSRTPTLILHGQDDPRVSVTQSRELYRHLSERSAAPVRLILYPGEGHGNSRAAARYDYSRRLMRWMDHYLLGEGGEPPPPRFDLPEGTVGASED